MLAKEAKHAQAQQHKLQMDRQTSITQWNADQYKNAARTKSQQVTATQQQETEQMMGQLAAQRQQKLKMLYAAEDAIYQEELQDLGISYIAERD